MPYDLLGAIAAAQIQPGPREVIRRDRVERLGPGPRDVFRNGLGASGLSLELAAQAHQALRIRIRQRLQQDRVDDGEDRRIGADAKGEGGDGDDAESGVFEDGTDRVADIRKQSAHSGILRAPTEVCS